MKEERVDAELRQRVEAARRDRDRGVAKKDAERAADRGGEQPFEQYGSEHLATGCAHHAQQRQIAFARPRRIQQRDEDRQASRQRQ